MLRTNHGELLDLFFARLLPSGTGDFDAGPSQLREKQTNPIMLLPYPLMGSFLIEMEPVGTRIASGVHVLDYQIDQLISTRRCTRIAISMIVLPTTFAFISTRRCTRIARVWNKSQFLFCFAYLLSQTSSKGRSQ